MQLQMHTMTSSKLHRMRLEVRCFLGFARVAMPAPVHRESEALTVAAAPPRWLHLAGWLQICPGEPLAGAGGTRAAAAANGVIKKLGKNPSR